MEVEEGEQAPSVVQDQQEVREEEMKEEVKEAPTNGETAAAVVNGEKKETNNTDDRCFTVKNLKHPGQWRTHSELIKIFDVCESFNIEFSPQDNKKQKIGIAHFVFPAAKDAQSAYKALESTKLDGSPIQIAVTDSFVLPSDFFSIPADEALRSRTLYALNLVSANKEFLTSILGSDAVESVSFLQQDEETQQAQVIMASAEEADSARQDANVFDDEEPNNEIKLFTPDEYLAFVQEKRVAKLAPAAKKEPEPVERKEEPSQLAPEIDENEVIDAINTHVEVQKLNWAELNDVEELYAICDVASSQFGGLPDSILKPSMLSTLQRHLSETDSHWLKEHLQVLIQVWKREVNSEQPFERESQVVMKAPDYEPVLITKKKRKEKDTRAARAMMGVGALLQITRNTLRTENGNVDIDEDDSGNILLNGEALSFDSWAKVTRTNQPDVVSTLGLEDGKQKAKKQRKQPEFQDYKALKQYQQEKYEKRMGDKKMKIMRQAREELQALESVERSAGGSDPPQPIPKAPKELDEGEIDSEEERKEAMNKRKHDSSSSSSSSSEESDHASGGNARARRKKAKLMKQKQQSNPVSNPRLVKMFDFRHQLMQSLPLEQKKLFLRVLREKMETKSAPTSDQSNLFRQFSDDCTRLSR